MKGVADFWRSRATANADGTYSVRNVAGPDEYSNGVDDGVFTNAVAATALRNATRAARLLGHRPPAAWNRVADGLRIPYDAERKVYLQYAGYNGSTIKQADTVLLTYPLEWPMEPGAAAATLDYYAARTDPDGPAMTDSVHAIDAAETGEPGCSAYTYLQRAVRPFMRGPYDLFSEARGEKAGAEDPLSGFPAEDFLTGKGGFLQVFTHGLTGLRLREDGVRLAPTLPPQLGEGVTAKGLRFRDAVYDVGIGPRTTTVRLGSGQPVHGPHGRGPAPADRDADPAHPSPRPDPDRRRGALPPATATSEAPGLYAEAAVDGSPATSWSPDGAAGSLTVDRPAPRADRGGDPALGRRTAGVAHGGDVRRRPLLSLPGGRHGQEGPGDGPLGGPGEAAGPGGAAGGRGGSGGGGRAVAGGTGGGGLAVAGGLPGPHALGQGGTLPSLRARAYSGPVCSYQSPGDQAPGCTQSRAGRSACRTGRPGARSARRACPRGRDRHLRRGPADFVVHAVPPAAVAGLGGRVDDERLGLVLVQRDVLGLGPGEERLGVLPVLPLAVRLQTGRGASTTSSRGMTSETPWEGKCARLPPSGDRRRPPGRARCR
ncbi:hypothetical protein SCALM49S_03113 [Streptomyces californicus]